ncbi:hypothetical protein E2542_SST04062 [Spatholobus suberectus]|nr:hypothetical protein E2542_SST04062 [Spatholobus suberectus]
MLGLVVQVSTPGRQQIDPTKIPIWLGLVALCLAGDVSTVTQRLGFVCLHVGLSKGCLQSFLAFCPPPLPVNGSLSLSLSGPRYVRGGGHTANRAVLASLCKASVIYLNFTNTFSHFFPWLLINMTNEDPTGRLLKFATRSEIKGNVPYLAAIAGVGSPII